MAAQNPNDNTPENEEIPPVEDIDQSDALKRAILKLRQSGMLTHVPDDLAALAGTDDSSDVQAVEQSAPAPEPKKEPRPDDQTIASRPKPESPTIASTDDVAKHADERAKWAAVMSGWEDAGSGEVPEVSQDSAPTIPSREALQKQTPATDEWSLPVESEPEEEPAAITLRRKEIKPVDDTPLTDSRDKTPWTLQQFFDGEIDLEQELLKRFPTVPAMTAIKFRTLGMNSGRKVATLTAQDGSSSIIIDADVETKVVQVSFTLGSMMTLRYQLNDIPANNRERWLELMRRDKGGLAFLWNEQRWREDYLICISREYSTNIFAFSPRNFESAVRISKNVTAQLLDWLEEVWNTEPEPDSGDDDAPLLTW